MSDQISIFLYTNDLVETRVLACDICLIARRSQAIQVFWFALILLQNYMYVGSCVEVSAALQSRGRLRYLRNQSCLWKLAVGMIFAKASETYKSTLDQSCYPID